MLEFLWCISHICPSSCTINLNGSGCFYLHLQSPRLLPLIFSTNFPPIVSKNLSIKLLCFLMRAGTRQCHLYAALDSSNKKPHRSSLWWVTMEICLIVPTWFVWTSIVQQPSLAHEGLLFLLLQVLKFCQMTRAMPCPNSHAWDLCGADYIMAEKVTIPYWANMFWILEGHFQTFGSVNLIRYPNIWWILFGSWLTWLTMPNFFYLRLALQIERLTLGKVSHLRQWNKQLHCHALCSSWHIDLRPPIWEIIVAPNL
jgi:hypothetical protein